MTLAVLENFRSRPQPAPEPDRDRGLSQERNSDVWPDWSTEIGEAELASSAEKNRPSVILREAVGAVLYSSGLVMLLIAILSALPNR